MAKKLGVIFSGFGSQTVGAAKDIYDNSRVVQEYFEEAYNCLGINFVRLSFASSDEELSYLENGYLTIFMADISIWSSLAELGVQPAVLAGLDAGWCAAMFISGGFSLPDALYLLNKYLGFYQEFLNQNLVKLWQVTGLTQRKLQDLIDASSAQVFITRINGSKDLLIGGLEKELELFRKDLMAIMLEDQKINYQEMSISLGLNSPLLTEPVADKFKIYLEKVDFKDLQYPIINPANGKLITTGKGLKKEIVSQISAPINWSKMMSALQDCDIILEVGPGKKLATELQQLYPDKQVLNLSGLADLPAVKSALSLDQIGEMVQVISESDDI